MALIKGDKVYRNLQEQVYENTCDIQELLRMYGYHGPYTSTDVIPADDLYNRAMYLIGTGMPYKVYQYNDLTKRFTYIGDYNMDVGPQGEPGPQGPQGERGPDGKPASEIVNIETYDVIYKQDVTESKVRANFDDGHSNEFTVYAKNGDLNDNNLIAGKGITVDYNPEDRTATIGVNNTIVDTNKLNEELLKKVDTTVFEEELPKKQDVLIPGDNITIVDNVISSTGGGGAANVVGGDGITVRNTDNKTVVNISNDLYKKINDIPSANNIVDTETDQYIWGIKHFTWDVEVGRSVKVSGSGGNRINIENGKIVGGQYDSYYDENNEIVSELENGIEFDLSAHKYDMNSITITKDKTSYGLKLPKKYGTLARVEDIPNITNLATKDEVTAVANDLSNHTNNTTIHVTNSDKSYWNNKVSQNQIADMATKTELNNYATKVELADYVTNDTFNTTVSSINNDIANVRNDIPDITLLATKAELTTELATKQDVITDLDTIRSGASAGATAVQPATLDDYAKTADVNATISDINNNKLDKVTKATSVAQVYYKAANGTNIMRDCNTGAVTNQSIMMRDNTGHCKIVDPVDDSDIANKKYVDDTITASTANMVTTDTEQTITGKKTFNDVTKFNKPILVNGPGDPGVLINSAVEVNSTSLTRWDVADDGVGIHHFTVKLPRKDGTLALTSDIPDMSNFVTKSEIPEPDNIVTTNTEQTINADKTIKGTFRIARADSSTAFRLYNDQADNIAFAGFKYVGNKSMRTRYSLPIYDTDTDKTIATADQIPTDYVALTGDQTINGKKTFNGGVTAANFTAQGNNESTIYGGTQMVHTFSDSTKLNLKYPKKSGNQTIATVGDIPNVSNMVTTDTEQTISGHKFFTDGSLDIAQKGNTTGAIRLYGSGGIGIYDEGAGSTRKAMLVLPRKSGTLALTSDIPTPTVIYNVPAGESQATSITMSDSFANYDYVDIQYRIFDNQDYVGCMRVYEPNGKMISLDWKFNTDWADANVYGKCARYTLNGTTMTVNSDTGYEYLNNRMGSVTKNTYQHQILITKVVGWKDSRLN